MIVLVTGKNKKEPIKNKEATCRVVTRFFSIITLWGLSVAIETWVLIRSDPKFNTNNPPTQMVSETFMFESVNARTDARTDAGSSSIL